MAQGVACICNLVLVFLYQMAFNLKPTVAVSLGVGDDFTPFFLQISTVSEMATFGYLIAFARGARVILQKPTGGLLVFKKERFDANYLKGLRETTQNPGGTVEQINCKHLQCLMYYQTGTCLCGSAAVRDSQQTISDLLPESHGCFGTGWVEFLLVATPAFDDQ